MSENHPWRDEDTLREMYHKKEMSQRAIADELGCSPRAVRLWMNKYDIESRGREEAVKLSSYNDEKPWQDKDTLKELYCEEGMSITEIANELDGGHTTISRWLHKHGIETKKGYDERPPHYTTDDDGYKFWRITDGDTYRSVAVHRLLAVAEYGLDATNGKHVHHKNHIPWDNRPKNIELKSPEQHLRDHAYERYGNGKAPWRDEEKLKQVVSETDTYQDAASELGCSTTTVRRWLNKYQ